MKASCPSRRRTALTHKTKKLHVLHSLASSLGHHEDDLTTKSLAIPTELDTLKEHVCLSYNLPNTFNRPKTEEDLENNEAEASSELASFLDGVEWEEEDIIADPVLTDAAPAGHNCEEMKTNEEEAKKK